MIKGDLLVTIPHSGEKIPEPASWLVGLSEPVLFCDVDRYVDKLYEDILRKLGIEWVKTDWHRYSADMNRVPTDIDRDSVEGAPNQAGTFNRGFHWVVTTLNDRLINKPMDHKTHQELINIVFNPFHNEIKNTIQKMRLSKDTQVIYHLDLHSMPSRGTLEHRDPNQDRADIVISDQFEKSACKDFVNLVMTSYLRAGFSVRYNWPYYGGRITEQYGNPNAHHHTVQVELNRKLYMNETTKKPNLNFDQTQVKLGQALQMIQAAII